MKVKYRNNPKLQEAKELYLRGHNFDEIGEKLGISALTVRTYLLEAKVPLDEAKYFRMLRSGEMVITSAGQSWAKEWDATRLPLSARLRYMA